MCLNSFQSLYQKNDTLPVSLTSKNLYSLLLDPVSAAPWCFGFWESAVGRPINRWASVWSKSRLKLVENKKNDSLWRILHRAVRVRYSLKLWGYIENDKCAVCGKIEIIEHCFLECPRIRKVWKYFPSTPSRLSCSPFVVSTSSVFYPFSIAPTSLYSSYSSFLIATIIFWIWSSRNFATFHNSTLTPKQIITLIRNDVASHIRCATEDSVKNFWSLLSVFCSVNDDHTITLHL